MTYWHFYAIGFGVGGLMGCWFMYCYMRTKLLKLNDAYRSAGQQLNDYYQEVVARYQEEIARRNIVDKIGRTHDGA